MKIIIVTDSFYPTISPRAFRAFELAKEFSKRDYEVDVYISATNFDYLDLEEEYGFTIIQLGDKPMENKDKGKNIPFKNTIKKIVRYCIGGEWALINYPNLFKKAYQPKEYDLLISIGLPFACHYASYKVMKTEKIAKVAVADYGDPYSKNKLIKKFPYYNILEKKVMNKFDYITVPISEAKESYLHLKSKDHIEVIPQAFDLANINIAEKTENKIVTFGYAGLFYKEIRNPKNLFETLSKIDQEFRFIIYTDIHSENQIEMIEKYEHSLKDKLILKDMINREDAIFELSKMDFLINLENEVSEQVPSKIIDYALTKRPILNLKPDNIDKIKLRSYINKDYYEIHEIDLTKYDVRNAVNNFLELHSKTYL